MNEKTKIPNVRAAIYMHAAVDHSIQTSLDDQERRCRAAAANQAPAWSIANEHIFTDSGVSALSSDRPGLESLLQMAAADNRPFEIVVVQSTVTLGRRFSVVLDVVDDLERSGVGVYFVDQMLDTRDDFFTTLAGLTRRWRLPQRSAL